MRIRSFESKYKFVQNFYKRKKMVYHFGLLHRHDAAEFLAHTSQASRLDKLAFRSHSLLTTNPKKLSYQKGRQSSLLRNVSRWNGLDHFVAPQGKKLLQELL